MYYLHYRENASINYAFLFCLHLLAERNTKEKINNIVRYTSIAQLSERIATQCNYKISASTISRIINDAEYNLYFVCQKKEKIITLNCNMKSRSTVNKFITLTDREIYFLLAQNDKLLIKYYLYIKYYCGYSKRNETDFTAKQFLAAVGYCQSSGKLYGQLSNYNNILSSSGFIKISKYRDDKGNERNIYRQQI